MECLIIDEHALKHGLSPEEIAHAWNNFALRQYRGAPNEGEVAAIGFDRSGRPVELVAIEKPFGTVIFHAIAPPTRNMLLELGFERRSPWMR